MIGVHLLKNDWGNRLLTPYDPMSESEDVGSPLSRTAQIRWIGIRYWKWKPRGSHFYWGGVAPQNIIV